MHRIDRRALVVCALVGILGMCVSLAVVMLFGPGRPRLYGDGSYYLDIGKAVAAGRGFTQPHSFWPGQPSLERPPLWPLVLAVPLRLFPEGNPVLAARCTAGAMQCLAACLTALLAWVFTGSRRGMLLAGLAVAVLPEAQPYLVAAEGEPCSGVLITLGTLLICLGGAWFGAGALVLGLLPLVRPNFVLWPVMIAAAYAIPAVRRRFLPVVNWRAMTAAAVLFYVPAGAWMLRNYAVSGGFPVLAGIEGETLYGAYNPVSTRIGPDLGGWVFPDFIPGQEKKRSLAARMSQVEISRYYRGKAAEFIREHWYLAPLMVTAHISRTLLPDAHGARHHFFYINWVVRLALYAAAILAMRRGARLEPWFGAILAGTVLLSCFTVVAFYGNDRFFYQVTVLLPCLLACCFRDLHTAPSRPVEGRAAAGVP